jgi:hypothetical protein
MNKKRKTNNDKQNFSNINLLIKLKLTEHFSITISCSIRSSIIKFQFSHCLFFHNHNNNEYHMMTYVFVMLYQHLEKLN